MKRLLSVVAVTLTVQASFAKVAKEKAVRFPSIKVTEDLRINDKVKDKINTITIKDFSVENAKITDVINEVVEASIKSDEKYKEGVNILYLQDIRDGVVDKAITWEKLPEMSLGALIDKVCGEFDFKWRAENSAIVIGRVLPLGELPSKTYSVPPAFVKIVLNFPYLKSNRTKLKKIALNEKNLIKGFKKFDISFIQPINFDNYKNYENPKSRAGVSYNPASRELTVTSGNLGRVGRLVSNWEKEKGGWKPFYNYLKLETKLRNTQPASLDVKNMSIHEVLAIVEKELLKGDKIYNEGIKLKNELPEDYDGTVTLRLKNMPAYKVLDFVCKSANLGYTTENGQIVVYVRGSR